MTYLYLPSSTAPFWYWIVAVIAYVLIWLGVYAMARGTSSVETAINEAMVPGVFIGLIGGFFWNITLYLGIILGPGLILSYLDQRKKFKEKTKQKQPSKLHPEE